MGTRSTIAVKHGERIKAVYCHWDGYVKGVGATLHEHYQASPKANNLIALGNISSLQAEIGEQHAFSKFDTPGIEMRVHNEDWCTFYGRDRGEQEQEFKSFGSEAEWMDYYDGSGAEYYYIMDAGVWYVSAYRKAFKPLHEEVALLDKEPA
jgi:hypothetical protein